jgi:hypothetical protein
MFLHDYWGLCKWRLYYPQQEKCKTCYLKDRFLDLHQNSNLMIWLSPLHRDSWMFTYPELESHEYSLIPSAINLDTFYGTDISPTKQILCVHGGMSFKGINRIREWGEEHPEKQIDIIGNIEGDLPSNFNPIDSIPPNQMGALYRDYESFLHLPTTPQPFERTIAEAYLSGCKIIGNENIGALSYDWFNNRTKVRQELQKASSMFWQEIEALV